MDATVFKASCMNAVREIAMAAHYIDQVKESPAGTPSEILAGDYADARACLTSAYLVLHELTEELQTEETKLTENP